MAVRILHCGKSVENYNLCVTEQVAGFTRRVASEGDTLFLAVRLGEETLCGVRAKLAQPTDRKPWEDAERYVQCFTLKDIEFCDPFDLSVLAEVAGKHWGIRYVQSAKPIKDEAALTILRDRFAARRVDHFAPLESVEAEDESVDDFSDNSPEIREEAESEIKVMGTFQTVKFVNETDPVRGLEPLVNANFYELFPHFLPDKTLLIAENRMFQTAGLETVDNEIIKGIRGIPDALLLVYDKDAKNPIQVNLIEYECYGENRIRSIDKFAYLNGHIIPQLMRFASTFSIVTDRHIREQTTRTWVQKIIDYIYRTERSDLVEKVTLWVKELHPGIHEHQVGMHLEKALTKAFRSNIRILLIIDELTSEQRETLKNVIASFKLDDNTSIEFVGYVVRLEQKIGITDVGAEYALSVQ